MNILSAVLIPLLIYVSIANVRYRFAHPEMTETELFLNTFEWIRWRD